jgi:hypothetical protein
LTGKDPKAKKFVKRRLLCGQGMRRLNGEEVANGDIIEVDDVKEVGNALDKFIVLNPQDVVETDVAEQTMTRKKKGLKRVKNEEGKGWNVLNQETGMFINDEPMKKQEAIAIVEDSQRED